MPKQIPVTTPVSVKIHIMPRLIQVGEYAMWERDMGEILIEMDSSQLRTEGYVTGLLHPKDLHAMHNHPAVSGVETLRR